jgi:glycosyltransferase involved in cell wall biosynthesis
MASGIPVVATNVGGADELVEHGVTGVLVPANNAELCADALGTILSNPELRLRMGQAGRRRAVTRFGLDRMLTEYTSLYEMPRVRLSSAPAVELGDRVHGA